MNRVSEAPADRVTDTRNLPGAWFIGVTRTLIGIMWFQQTLWKLPWYHYGELPDWLHKSSASPTFGWYKMFVDHLVLPNFEFFAFFLWLIQTVIAFTLILGFCARLGGLLGGLMGLNLYAAVSHVPGEWYWTYIFIALINFLFFFTRAGRYLGIDQLFAPALVRAANQGKPTTRVLRWLV